MKAGWMLAILVAGTLGAGAAEAQELFSSDDMIIQNEGKIGDRWMLAPGAVLATPAYPAHLAARGDDVCLGLGYKINEDGTTSDFVVLKQWSSAGEQEPVDGYWSAFAQAGADALSQWRFQHRPGIAAVRPSYTVATLAFNSGEADAAGLRAHCAIPDLVAAIQERKSHRYNHSLEQRTLERANRIGRSIPRPPMAGKR